MLILIEHTFTDKDQPLPVVRGVFSSLEALEDALRARLVESEMSFLSQDDHPEAAPTWIEYEPTAHQFIYEPADRLDEDLEDLDISATDEIVLLLGEGWREPIYFFVWDSEKRQQLKMPLKLYWCESADHDEDWFLVARSYQQARLAHAETEGYELAEVTAEYLLTLPEALQQQGDELLGWPSHEVLSDCGAVLLRAETPRTVLLGERRFEEGRRSSARSEGEVFLLAKGEKPKKLH